MLAYAVVIHCSGKKADGSPCDESVIYECPREPGPEERDVAMDTALREGWVIAHRPPGNRIYLCRWCARRHFALCINCGQETAAYCCGCMFST